MVNKKNKNKQKIQKNNPLSNMDPISQIREFKENVHELNDNFKNIINIVKPMVKNGLVMPCNIAKNFSNTLCSLTDNASSKIDLLNDSLSNVNLDNLIDNSITNNVSNIIGGDPSSDNVTNLKSHPKLYKSGRYFGRNRLQSGGNFKDCYQYIVNPNTGRKVLVKGRIGQKVLNQYINQI